MNYEQNKNHNIFLGFKSYQNYPEKRKFYLSGGFRKRGAEKLPAIKVIHITEQQQKNIEFKFHRNCRNDSNFTETAEMTPILGRH